MPIAPTNVRVFWLGCKLGEKLIVVGTCFGATQDVKWSLWQLAESIYCSSQRQQPTANMTCFWFLALLWYNLAKHSTLLMRFYLRYYYYWVFYNDDFGLNFGHTPFFNSLLQIKCSLLFPLEQIPLHFVIYTKQPVLFFRQSHCMNLNKTAILAFSFRWPIIW